MFYEWNTLSSSLVCVINCGLNCFNFQLLLLPLRRLWLALQHSGTANSEMEGGRLEEGGGGAVSLSPLLPLGCILMCWRVVNNQNNLIFWVEMSTDVVRLQGCALL